MKFYEPTIRKMMDTNGFELSDISKDWLYISKEEQLIRQFIRLFLIL